MMPKMMPTVSEPMSLESITCSSNSTTPSRIRPQVMAERMVGTVNRSLVRKSVAPRRRSCGRTMRTTKSTIIGSAMRKFEAHDHDSGKYPST